MSTIEGYVATQEWRRARLPGCPLHSSGSCSFRRHGSYARVTSPGVRIARYYCPQGHMTFSLLPDFLAAQLPGSLMAVDRVVATAISARSMEAAADTVRGLEVCLPGAVRWLRRRVTAVRRSVAAVRMIAPSLSRQDLAEGKMPPLTQLRRALAPQILHGIPPPLGFQRYQTRRYFFAELRGTCLRAGFDIVEEFDETGAGLSNQSKRAGFAQRGKSAAPRHLERTDISCFQSVIRNVTDGLLAKWTGLGKIRPDRQCRSVGARSGKEAASGHSIRRPRHGHRSA